MEEIGAERERQERYQIAIRLIKMDLLSVEDIAKATDLSIEDVQALAAMVKATA
ncbi:hypothetical protein [Ruminococcus albus]|nr:hypothetical protein [Ruminococcus albus]